jgi:thiamine biosynthesis protein ThiS
VQSQLFDITVNGEPKQLPSGHSVAQLLHRLNISPDRVAVELNRSIVRKRDWEHTAVPNNSSIEIVEFVGGG